MIRLPHLPVTWLVGMALLVGCQHEEHGEHHKMMMSNSSAESGVKNDTNGMHNMHGTMMANDAMAGKTAVAIIRPAKAAASMKMNNDVTGNVTFTQMGNDVKVVADLSGLAPNTKHGFHIHDKGDLSAPDLSSAGGHFNPEGHKHGAPNDGPVHAGDLGNAMSDANGKVHYEITVSDISLGGAKDNIVGHSVIVHADPDDLTSQPTGNSGARIAGGVIEMQE